MNFDDALGLWTGLALLAPEMAPATLRRTALLVHVCDAVVCAILARKAGRRRGAWTVAGFLGGVWALALLLVLPARPAKLPPAHG